MRVRLLLLVAGLVAAYLFLLMPHMNAYLVAHQVLPPQTRKVGVSEASTMMSTSLLVTQEVMIQNKKTDCRIPALAAIASPLHVKESTLSYLRHNVTIAMVTGSFENFYRVDLAMCTWMQHVPSERLFIYTDNANRSDGRRGQWVEGALPSGVKFSQSQLEAKGYTIHWIKAQYRFLQGLGEIVNGAGANWYVVLDDDTFVNLDAMVVLLKRYDKSRRGSPTYLGDHGWGGAGHFFNKAAGGVLRTHLGQCIDTHMVKSFKASDVMLKKCVAELRIGTEWEKLLSHCQANFLRERMVDGHQVTFHLKREMVEPKLLAAWRLRLYYQVIYHKNYTSAYKLLLKVGSCAYGSCKNNKCEKAHDEAAIAFYEEVSGNGSYVPTL